MALVANGRPAKAVGKMDVGRINLVFTLAFKLQDGRVPTCWLMGILGSCQNCGPFFGSLMVYGT